MNSASVDLIATDPPFNSKRLYNAPLESSVAGQRFDDRWRWDDVTNEWQDLIAVRHPAIKEIIEAAAVIEGGKIYEYGHIDTGKIQNSIAAFLVWMAPRLLEMKRILKPTGSIYLHCDPAANSYLRLLMDAIFGRSNFRNEIAWYKGYRGTPRKRQYQQEHDTILMYAGKGYTWNNQTVDYKDKSMSRYNKTDEDGNKYALIKRKRTDGTIYYGKTYPKGKLIGDVINIPTLSATSKERTKWRTQKPLSLYEKIIQASSNENDIVLDPFCGCATTCVAAEGLGRQWVGIDIDPVAETVTNKRLFDKAAMDQMLDDNFVKVSDNPPSRTDIPKMTPAEIKLVLWNIQGGKCANPYCTLEKIPRPQDMELDHRIPKIRGGEDDLPNRMGLCGNCNRRKSKKAWKLFLDQERSKQPHPVVGNYGQ